MGKDTARQDNYIHRFVPDRYTDPRRANLYTYYNEFFVYAEHARLLIRRVDSREVVTEVLFDKEKLDHITPLHWSTGRRKLGLHAVANNKSLSFGRALGMTYNGRVFALTGEGVYDFRSHRVIPMSDRRFETVDADTMKLVLRRPSDGEIFHVLFDSDAYETIKDTTWWVPAHDSIDGEGLVIFGSYNGRVVMLDALLLGFPKGLIRKYPRDRRKLDYRRKALRKRVVLNAYRAVSADTVALVVSHPVLKAFTVLIDKQARKKVAAHRWTVRRTAPKKGGRRAFYFVNEERTLLTEVILGAAFVCRIPVGRDGVYDCRRKSLLRKRQLNTCTVLGEDAVRLDIIHADGKTRVLLDKENYERERVKQLRWYVEPAGPKGCCRIRNEAGSLLHRQLFGYRKPLFVREYWPMSGTIDFRKEALITCVSSAYRQLDRLSGEMVLTSVNKAPGALKGSQSEARLQILHVRLDHEDGLKLDRHNWSWEPSDNGGAPRIFSSSCRCMLRLVRKLPAFVILTPEYDESGRLDARKLSLARWCPENHYRFPDARRMELIAPGSRHPRQVTVLLDRRDYDRLRRHMWKGQYNRVNKRWTIRNRAGEELKKFLFGHRFSCFHALPAEQFGQVLDYRLSRLARYGMGDKQAAAPETKPPKPGYNEYTRVDEQTMMLTVRRVKDDAVFEILFDSEDYDRIKPFSWWVVDCDSKDGRVLNVRSRGGYKGKKVQRSLDTFLLGCRRKAKIIKYSADLRRLDYRKQTLLERNVRNIFRTLPDGSVEMTLYKPGETTYKVLIDARDYPAVSKHRWRAAWAKNKKREPRLYFYNENHEPLLSLVRGETGVTLAPQIQNGVCDYRRKNLPTAGPLNRWVPAGDKAVCLEIEDQGGTVRVLLDKEDAERLNGRHWYFKVEDEGSGHGAVCSWGDVYLHRAVFFGRIRMYAQNSWPRDTTIDFRKQVLIGYVISHWFEPLDRKTAEVRVADTDRWVRLLVDREDIVRIRSYRWRCEWLPGKKDPRLVNLRGMLLQTYLLRMKTPFPETVALQRDRQGRIDCRKQSLRARLRGGK